MILFSFLNLFLFTSIFFSSPSDFNHFSSLKVTVYNQKELNDFRDFKEQNEKEDDFKNDKYEELIKNGKDQLFHGDYQKALGIFYDAYALSEEHFGHNSMETAEVLRQMVIALSYTNNIEELLRRSDEVLEIYENIQPSDPFILFRQYSSNYQSYKYYGDVKKTNELFSKLKGYYEANLYNPAFINYEHPDYPNLNPIKTIYYFVLLQDANFREDTESAEKAFMQFQNLMKPHQQYIPFESNTIMGYYLETGSLFHKIGVPDKNMAHYKKAKSYYEKSLDFAEKQDFGFGVMQAYMMLSMVSADYEQWEDAIFYSEKGLTNENIAIFNQTQTLNHHLAMAYAALNQTEKVFSLLEEEYLFYKENENEIDYSAMINILESADVYLKFFEKNGEKDFIENAFENFYLASRIFSRLYRGGEFSPRLYEYVTRINAGLLKTSYELKKDPIDILERIEINNSDYLWTSFLSNRSVLESGVLEIQDQLDSLKLLKKELATEITDRLEHKEEVDSLRKQLKSYENQSKNLTEELKNYDYAFYEFSRTDFDAKRIQKDLKENERIIKYIINQLSAFAFIITKNEIDLIKLSESESLIRKHTNDFLFALKNIDADFIEKSKELYQILIAPLVLSGNYNTVIIPDGFLANLPFEALMSSTGNYLLNEFPIGYANSLRLFEIQRNLEKDFKGNLAAFAPTYDYSSVAHSEKRSGHFDLKGAKEEVEKISAFFPSRLFVDTDATKGNFIEISDNYDIIHLAMHANVDEENPNFSNLIFFGDEALYLNELYKLKIPAHLAVLSACSTGVGELKDGEGTQSLSRAFTYAGVKSTVMSLWPVPDKQTSEIITYFYSFLKDGKPKNEALKLAKQKYLDNTSEEVLKHPFYWAGFIVTGDISPLIAPSSNWVLWILGISISLILLGSIFYFKRRRKV